MYHGCWGEAFWRGAQAAFIHCLSPNLDESNMEWREAHPVYDGSWGMAAVMAAAWDSEGVATSTPVLSFSEWRRTPHSPGQANRGSRGCSTTVSTSR